MEKPEVTGDQRQGHICHAVLAGALLFCARSAPVGPAASADEDTLLAAVADGRLESALKSRAEVGS